MQNPIDRSECSQIDWVARNISSLILRPRTFWAGAPRDVASSHPQGGRSPIESFSDERDIGILVLPQHFPTFLRPIPVSVRLLVINVTIFY
jgi:hypothetical protein